MGIYKFFDTDITGHEDYDISGKAYQKLIQTCFQYCTTVSVIISPNFIDDLAAWEPYRIPKPANSEMVYCHYGVPSPENANRINDYEIRYYRLVLPMQELILSRTESIFQWVCGWGYNNPDDITFYRADGSVFFTSVIHEGECTLSPRADENIKDIITQEHWISV